MPTAFITGVNGQDGSYLAELLLQSGYRVIGLLRPGSEIRSDRIGNAHARIELVACDPLDSNSLRDLLVQYQPSEFYNLGARASSSNFFDDTVRTSECNGLAVLKILEAIRAVDPAIRFCQASSSEMFGNAPVSPQNETTAFRPRNPYGVAKLFAHGMVGMYRDHFGLFACSALLFNHESPRRDPEFVTRRITLGVARINAGLADCLRLGNLDATRDWGYAADYVRAMWKMLQVPAADDYVVATGHSHSVRQFCEIAFAHVGLDYRDYVQQDADAYRPADIVPLVGDAAKARDVLGWRPTISFERLVQMMLDADIERLHAAREPGNR